MCGRGGAQVLIISRNEAKLHAACTQIGDKARYIVWDMRNVSTFRDLLEQSEKTLGGRLDSLISNAGVLGGRLFLSEEVANVVHFLLTDASAAIAGEIINCDQGFYNGR